VDNYLNLENRFYFKRLQRFLAVQELCLEKKSKLNKFWGTCQNPGLFNPGPHNVHNSA